MQYDPAIQSSRYDTIQRTKPIRSTRQSQQYFKTHPQLPHCLSIHILHHISCWWPLIWFFTLPSGLYRQTFSLFLCCRIFCSLFCLQFRWRRLQGQFFGLSNYKSYRAILGGNPQVLDGATPAPLLLLFFGWLFIVSSCVSSMLTRLVWNCIPWL